MSDSILSAKIPGTQVNLWIALGGAAAFAVFVLPGLMREVEALRKIDNPRKLLKSKKRR